MKNFITTLVFIFLTVNLFSQSESDKEKGNPIENFEYFFQTFEKNYALFGVKNIDWQEIHDFYSKEVDENTTDDELFDIFKESLKRLDDKHCYIYRFNEIYFSGYDLPPQNYLDLLSFDFRVDTDDFLLKLIEKKYLNLHYSQTNVVKFVDNAGYNTA